MPKMVPYTYCAESLRQGDKLVWRNREWTVERIERKTKYAYVSVAESLEPFRIDLSHNVKLFREEPTWEERLEQAEEHAAMQLRDLTKRCLYELEDDKDKLRKKLNDDNLKIGHWDLDKFLVAQERWTLAHRVRWALIRLAGMEKLDPHDVERIVDTPTDEQVIEAYREVLNEMQQELWSHRASTRSGLTLNNAIEDVERDAWRDWRRYAERYLNHIDFWRSKGEGTSAEDPR